MARRETRRQRAGERVARADGVDRPDLASRVVDRSSRLPGPPPRRLRPSVTTTTWATPTPSAFRSRSVRAASTGRCSGLAARPRRAASVATITASSRRLTVRTSARPNAERSMPVAGAGLKTTVAPASRPSFRAWRAEIVGISWPTRTTSPAAGPRASSAVAMSLGVSAAFAPDATAIMFSPPASTRIRATPVRPSTVVSPVRSMPSRSSAARARIPNASRPTAPTNAVGAPSRAAATAWLAPLPPSCSENVAPVTVSPAAGNRSAWATRSTLTEPDDDDATAH